MSIASIKIKETKKPKRRRNKLHISAGGVIYRQSDHRIEVVLLYRRATQSWHLPKGTREKKETRRDTAIREVREETGLKARIEKYLGWLPSIYFSSSGVKIHKKTYYYLMEPVEGSFRNHDREHDQVKWVEINQARKLLAHTHLWEKEDKIIKKVIQLLGV